MVSLTVSGLICGGWAKDSKERPQEWGRGTQECVRHSATDRFVHVISRLTLQSNREVHLQ